MKTIILRYFPSLGLILVNRRRQIVSCLFLFVLFFFSYFTAIQGISSERQATLSLLADNSLRNNGMISFSSTAWFSYEPNSDLAEALKAIDQLHARIIDFLPKRTRSLFSFPMILDIFQAIDNNASSPQLIDLVGLPSSVYEFMKEYFPELSNKSNLFNPFVFQTSNSNGFFVQNLSLITNIGKINPIEMPRITLNITKISLSEPIRDKLSLLLGDLSSTIFQESVILFSIEELISMLNSVNISRIPIVVKGQWDWNLDITEPITPQLVKRRVNQIPSMITTKDGLSIIFFDEYSEIIEEIQSEFLLFRLLFIGFSFSLLFLLAFFALFFGNLVQESLIQDAIRLQALGKDKRFLLKAMVLERFFHIFVAFFFSLLGVNIINLFYQNGLLQIAFHEILSLGSFLSIPIVFAYLGNGFTTMINISRVSPSQFDEKHSVNKTNWDLIVLGFSFTSIATLYFLYLLLGSVVSKESLIFAFILTLSLVVVNFAFVIAIILVAKLISKTFASGIIFRLFSKNRKSSGLFFPLNWNHIAVIVILIQMIGTLFFVVIPENNYANYQAFIESPSQTMIYDITNRNYSLMENFVTSFRATQNISLIILLDLPLQQETSIILMGIDAFFYNVSLKKSYVAQNSLKRIPNYSMFGYSSLSFRVLASPDSSDSLLVSSKGFLNQIHFDDEEESSPVSIRLDIMDYFDKFPLISGNIINSDDETKTRYVSSRNALNAIFNLTALSQYMDLVLLVDAPSDELAELYNSLNDFTDFSITTYETELRKQLNPFTEILRNSLSIGLYYSAIIYTAINFANGVFLDRDEKELIRYLKSRHTSSTDIYNSMIISKIVFVLVSFLIGWLMMPFLVVITQFLWLGTILPRYAFDNFLFVFGSSLVFLVAGWVIPYALVARRSLRQISLLQSYSVI